MSTSEGEEGGEKEEVYMYRIPTEEVDGVMSPVYEPVISGGLYMFHYSPNHLYVIQGDPAPHLHKEDMNVVVSKLDRQEVEESDDVVGDFV